MPEYPRYSIFVVTIMLSCWTVESVIRNFKYSSPFSTNCFSFGSSEVDPNTCVSKECHKADLLMWRKVNLYLNPCDDFYEYSCNGFIKASIPVFEDIKTDDLMSAHLDIMNKVKEILDEPIYKADIRPVKIMKKMYQSCVKHDSSIPTFIEFVNQLGGWYLLNPKWNVDEFTLEGFYTKSFQRGYEPTSLFGIFTIRDMKNTSRYAIYISEPHLFDEFVKQIIRVSSPLAMPEQFDSEYRKFLARRLLKKIAEKLGVDSDIMRNEMFKFLEVFDYIKWIYGNRSLEFLEMYHPMTLKQLQNTYYNFPWMVVLREGFSPAHLTDDEIVVVTCPECLKKLNDFLGQISKRNLANYLMWSLFMQKIADIDSELMNELMSFLSSLNQSQIARQGICAEEVANMYRRVVDYQYINKYFDKSIKKSVSRFVDRMKNELKYIVRRSTIMNKGIRKYVIEKVDAITYKVAYDDEINDEHKLINFYEKLHIDHNSYFLAVLNTTKFLIMKTVEMFARPAELEYLEATSGNAAYLFLENSITVSASVLAGISYSKNRPKYLNFGTLGFIIGHELMHAFDNKGHLFDKHGNLNSWWDSETERNYRSKFECFVGQYSKYINPETNNKVNGTLTLGENLADNGGILVAYKAYQRYTKEIEKKEKMLSHFLDLSPKQLFWISFATLTCSRFPYDYVLETEKTDVHPLFRHRINGMVSNNRYFSKDFHCASGSAMNPKKKCTIWS